RFEQTLECSVKRAGPEANRALRLLGDLLHDRIAMPLRALERQQDVKCHRGQGQERFGAGRLMTEARHTISSSDTEENAWSGRVCQPELRSTISSGSSIVTWPPRYAGLSARPG